MNVLVIAPHPDDESIGCGGAVLGHADAGDVVTAVFMTSGELGIAGTSAAEAISTREAEAAEAAAVLGIGRIECLRQPDWSLCDHVDDAVARLAMLLGETLPAVVYVPHPADAHPDHRASAVVTRTALAAWGRDAEVRAYEVWTPLPTYDVVVDITAVLDRKLAAIRCHRSQRGNRDFARAARALSEYRGALDSHCEYAEVFATVSSSAGWQAPADVHGWAPQH